VAAILAGVVLFPILLPWLPGHDFLRQGFFLGGVAAVPLPRRSSWVNPGAPWVAAGDRCLSYLLALPPVTASWR